MRYGQRSVAEFEQMTRGRVASVEVREANVDVDRIRRNLHGLNDGDAGPQQRLARLSRLVDASENDRFGELAERGRNRPFFVARRVIGIQDENLNARRHEHVVSRPQIVVENAVGERRNDHGDAPGA